MFQIIPETMFSLLDQIIQLQTNQIKEIQTTSREPNRRKFYPEQQENSHNCL